MSNKSSPEEGRVAFLSGLVAAAFIVVVEIAGQFWLRGQLDPKVEQLRASLERSQEFYKRQLEVLEEGFKRLRSLEEGIRLAGLNADNDYLRIRIQSWSQWKNENELYLSRKLYRHAGELSREAAFFLRSHLSDGDTDLKRVRELQRLVKEVLRNEARSPAFSAATMENTT